MKLLLLAVSLMALPQSSLALDRLPLPGAPTSSAKSPLQHLESVARDPRYVTCRKDLEVFRSHLSPSDFAEIRKQQSKFNAVKAAQILKSGAEGMKSSPVQSDEFTKSVSVLIPHGKMKCEISIYPKQEMDPFKANPDPSVDVGEISSTLMGSSFDADENSVVHFDPTKAMTLLKQNGVLEISEQVKVLEQFQAKESQTHNAEGPRSSSQSSGSKAR